MTTLSPQRTLNLSFFLSLSLNIPPSLTPSLFSLPPHSLFPSLPPLTSSLPPSPLSLSPSFSFPLHSLTPSLSGKFYCSFYSVVNPVNLNFPHLSLRPLSQMILRRFLPLCLYLRLAGSNSWKSRKHGRTDQKQHWETDQSDLCKWRTSEQE